MWAEVGRYALAAGPYGLATILAVMLIALLGAVFLMWTASKTQMPPGEVEVQVRILGIKVSVRRGGKNPSDSTPDGATRKKEHRFRIMDSKK
jgi:hypothetical protein